MSDKTSDKNKQAIKTSDNISYRKTHRKLYEVWHSMKQRCDNKNHPKFHVYGGRWITYVPEWSDAKNFCNWALNNGYKEGLEIDRINVNGNYEPNNCRWVDRKTNAQNQRKAIIIEVNGMSMCAAEWERFLGIGKSNIMMWIRRWGIEFTKSRIKEILETGTYKRYGKNQVKKIVKEEGGIE